MNCIQISNSSELAEQLNKASASVDSGTEYRVETIDGVDVVTNMPTAFYSHADLKKYCPPAELNEFNDDNFINVLLRNFDQIQQAENRFHYNQCGLNSLYAYRRLFNLAAGNVIPITTQPSICFGYMEKTILSNSKMGNAVRVTNELILHDWHVWNKVNDFIIDLSVMNNHAIAELGSSSENRIWQNADDHTFKYHSPHRTYYGIDFYDHLEFDDFTKKLFKS